VQLAAHLLKAAHVAHHESPKLTEPRVMEFRVLLARDQPRIVLNIRGV
jgi:hypothetical protein